MQSPLQELETTYFTLQAQINMLSLACKTPEQRDPLSAQYVKARQNYWACVNKAFHDDDPQVVSLTSQLNAANQQLSDAVKEMGDITKVISTITNVVSMGEQLDHFQYCCSA
jgi:ABC-type proline/glycine betaine transport system substrate-binding protein